MSFGMALVFFRVLRTWFWSRVFNCLPLQKFLLPWSSFVEFFSHMGKFWHGPFLNLDIYFSLLSPFSNHISFYHFQLDRYRHPSASESQGSTSPDSSSQDREKGRLKLKTKTLDGSALNDDVDNSMQRDEASSSRHHWGDGLDGSFMIYNHIQDAN